MKKGNLLLLIIAILIILIVFIFAYIKKQDVPPPVEIPHTGSALEIVNDIKSLPCANYSKKTRFTNLLSRRNSF